jgi:adenine phosphoribosyltransferase
MHVSSDYIKSRIRAIPDWPEKGVMFRDITPIFQDPIALRGFMDAFVQRYLSMKVDAIAGIDARGFLLGVTVAYELNLPFFPIRKKGKLPWDSISEEYALEYGTAAIEIHKDACKNGDRVVMFDDLIATGGTMIAATKLVKRIGGTIVEAAAIVDLPDLGGSRKIKESGTPVYSICSFDGH